VPPAVKPATALHFWVKEDMYDQVPEYNAEGTISETPTLIKALKRSRREACRRVRIRQLKKEDGLPPKKKTLGIVQVTQTSVLQCEVSGNEEKTISHPHNE